MRYTEQQQFIHRGRIWGAAAVAGVLAAAAVCLKNPGAALRPLLAIQFASTILALAISIYYTPDYLHLSVTPGRKLRWETKVRWRIIAAALIFGLFSVTGLADVVVLIAAIAWLAVANLLGKTLGARHSVLYFWTTDFILLAFLLLSGKLNPLLAPVLLAAAAHLAVVISERLAVLWASMFSLLGCLLLVVAGANDAGRIVFAEGSLVLFAAFGTALLVRRAQEHNEKNVAAALRELMDFTGYAAERVRHLWSTSNQELAKNWRLAELDGADRDRLAEWYRDNSELYMFAISAYNLEYKRIRSNLKVLRLGRGSCLDYGAGNGEILLELAARGHATTYYDVEGQSMKFARWRAARRNLQMEFLHTKEALAASVRGRGFDTVFSFDVLEHLPDLPGELSFLSSLLSPGGLLVFDVPAGSTQAHPMHLNHTLDVCSYALDKGLTDERGLLQKLPYRKEEKYFFRATQSPGSI